VSHRDGGQGYTWPSLGSLCPDPSLEWYNWVLFLGTLSLDQSVRRVLLAFLRISFSRLKAPWPFFGVFLCQMRDTLEYMGLYLSLFFNLLKRKLVSKASLFRVFF